MNTNTPFERAMKLAIVSGLRAAMGPALVAASQNRPEKAALVAAAMGEMILDKLPILPSRARLPLLLPRVFAGWWSAKQSLEHDGVDDPTAAATAAAVSAGVATLAPMVRGALKKVLGIPDPVLGALEDYLALRLGGEAVGLSLDDLKGIAMESAGQLQEQIAPTLQSIRS